MREGLLRLGTAASAVLTLIPLSRSKRWWVRDLDFPRLQLSALIAALAAAHLARRSPWHLLGPTLLCLAYQAKWILPYSRLRRKQVPSAARPPAGPTLRILTANVLKPNRRAADFLALVRREDPDVVVTLETDRWWEESLRPLEDSHPHAVKCALENTYGMHVYSRLPLEDAKVEFLVEKGVPSIRAVARLRGGRRVALRFVHPQPPRPESESSEPRDTELAVVARTLDSLPTVVAGDLNDVAWSRTTREFLRKSGLVDPRVGRGMLNTFHARWRLMRWPLDHVFHSRSFSLVQLKRLPSFGSDHFPVLVELACER